MKPKGFLKGILLLLRVCVKAHMHAHTKLGTQWDERLNLTIHWLLLLYNKVSLLGFFVVTLHCSVAKPESVDNIVLTLLH